MKLLNLGASICALIVLISGISEAFSQNKPEPVPYIRQAGVKPHAWYVRQAELWQQEVTSNSRNAEGWKNYYLATEYSYFGKENPVERAAALDRILAEMNKAVPNSYEYVLMKYRRSPGGLAALEKAYQLRPEQPDTYYDLIVAYELERRREATNAMCKKLYESRDLAPALLDYNYNVLMSTEKNAFLFTNGDNDTYPVWLLQSAKDIRAEVTVLNVHLIKTYPEYLKKLLQERQITLDWAKLPAPHAADFIAALCEALAPRAPVYFALTVAPSYVKPLADKLFVVGLAYRYSPQRFDNVSALQRNWEESFRLDYLSQTWYDEQHPATLGIMPGMNGNYLAPLVLLIEHAKAKGDLEKSKRLRGLALAIAQKAGNAAELQKLLGEK